MDFVLFTSPIALPIIGVIIALHIVSAIPRISAPSKSRLPIILLGSLNLLLHIALVAFSVVTDAPSEELFMAVMLSAAVGASAMGISEWLAGRKREEGEE